MTLSFSAARGVSLHLRLPRLPGRIEPSAFRRAGGEIKGRHDCVSSWGISRWRPEVYLSISLFNCISLFNLHIFFLLNNETCTEFICLFPFIQFTYSSEEKNSMSLVQNPLEPFNGSHYHLALLFRGQSLLIGPFFHYFNRFCHFSWTLFPFLHILLESMMVKSGQNVFQSK